jgi:anti-sigma-K factor RskA
MTERDDMAEHSKFQDDAAAFVLGALDPEEAQAFVEHLQSCAVCRDEVAAFALVADALPMAAPQHQASRALRKRVIRAVRDEPKESETPAPRRRVWALPSLASMPRGALAGGVAVLVALAVVVGVLIGSRGSSSRLIQASVGNAQLRVTGDRGELIVNHLPSPGTGRIYEMWLQHGSAAPKPSTLFGVTSSGTAELGVPGSLNGVSRVLVTAEPAGGTQAPTTTPVIVAPTSD